MGQSSSDRTLEIISNHQEQIADFARKSYAHDGRGAVGFEVPALPPGAVVGISSTMMKYLTLEQLRQMAAESPDRAEDLSGLVRMVETYDPDRQAVVTAAIRGQTPISIKMRLQRPLVGDESPNVH